MRAALWSQGRLFASYPEDTVFESWQGHKVESLEKAFYSHFLTALMCLNEYLAVNSAVCVQKRSVLVPHGSMFRPVLFVAVGLGPHVKRFELSRIKRYIKAHKSS